MQEFYKLLGIQGNPSTAYHPQTDGQTERMNQEIEVYLRSYISFMQDDWSEWLASAEFALNNRQHSLTKHSPFLLNYGYHPRMGEISIPKETHTPAATDFVEKLQKTREKAKEALAKAIQYMKTAYDKHKNTKTHEYTKGTLVWLDSENLNIERPNAKLADKRVGPFVITEKVGKSAYRLNLPISWRIHPVFNETLLTPYTEGKFPNQEKDERPPPELINDHEQYRVEEILKSRKRGCGIQYLVKWEGYPHEDNTWEPKKNLAKAPKAIVEFHKKYPNATHALHVRVAYISITERARKGPRKKRGKIVGKSRDRECRQI